MLKRTAWITAALVVFVGIAVFVPRAQRGPDGRLLPGLQGGNVTLLPNGWKISPAGEHINVGDLPLNMTLSPDGRYLIITNNGYAKPTLTVVDLVNRYVKASVPVDHAWFGLAWHPDGRRLYSSGASQNTVNEFTWKGNTLTLGPNFVLGRPERQGARFMEIENAGFIGGVAVHPDGKTLYAVHVLGTALSVVDLERNRVRDTVELPSEPYTCMVAPDGRTLYVSLWGDREFSRSMSRR